jgi:hypothetical protein
MLVGWGCADSQRTNPRAIDLSSLPGDSERAISPTSPHPQQKADRTVHTIGFFDYCEARRRRCLNVGRFKNFAGNLQD